MRVQHKKTLEEHEISVNDWQRIKELDWHKSYKIISGESKPEHIVDIKAIKPQIERIDLNESLETAIYNEGFNSSKYTVAEINKFLKENPDKREYFKDDKRKSIDK